MSFINNLVSVANQELKLWAEGGWVECAQDKNTKQPFREQKKQPGAVRVYDYWLKGIGEKNRHGCIKLAWSAAFICWCLRNSGMKLEQFPISGSHQAYIRWSINNSKFQKADKSYYGRKANEYMPRPGDIIAQWRKEKVSDPNPNISYDNQPDEFYISHCDIVVSATATSVIAIGGNVSHRVKETKFEVRNGLFVPKKEIICIMQCKMG
ncbi:MAG: DUF2272 domain-containing protein [Methylotenera sp.]